MAAGPWLVKDINPNAGGELLAPRITAVAGNRAFFWKLAGFDSTYSLWITNGSPAGTFRVSEPLRIPLLAPAIWVASRKFLFFTAAGAGHGDGTEAGALYDLGRPAATPMSLRGQNVRLQNLSVLCPVARPFRPQRSGFSPTQGVALG